MQVYRPIGGGLEWMDCKNLAAETNRLHKILNADDQRGRQSQSIASNHRNEPWKEVELADKPGSVVGSHSSGTTVARRL